ncbi:MAG: transposase [Rhodothermaceae bacterium]|nr:helix-turn-helix domain-containing protein [Rhodothermaceae bacterium RA]GIV57679.1 MAG: transposase [Rhodothermaceae bacterium]
MPAPLSTDLRWRIARAYERGEGSRADLAQRFAVGKASVDRVIRQARQSGSLEPKKPGGSRRLLTEADEALVRSWIEAQPDLTQDELAQRFTEHTGRRVSRRTMGRVRARLGLTRKKRRCRPRSNSAPTS